MEGVLLPQRTDPSSKDRGVWLCGRHRDLKTWGGVREVENTHLRTAPPPISLYIGMLSIS